MYVVLLLESSAISDLLDTKLILSGHITNKNQFKDLLSATFVRVAPIFPPLGIAPGRVVGSPSLAPGNHHTTQLKAHKYTTPHVNIILHINSV